VETLAISGIYIFLWPVLIIFAENAIKFERDMQHCVGDFSFSFHNKLILPFPTCMHDMLLN